VRCTAGRALTVPPQGRGRGARGSTSRRARQDRLSHSRA
jgi:hypothetical protein